MPLDSSGAGASEGMLTGELSVEGVAASVGGGTGGVAVVSPTGASVTAAGLAVSAVAKRNVASGVIGGMEAGVESP
jgi:hypothetical protein